MNDNLTIEDWKEVVNQLSEDYESADLKVQQYEAAFELLEAEEAFIGTDHIDHSSFDPNQENPCKGKEHKPCFALLINDTYGWAESDAEALPMVRWIEARDVYKQYGHVGLIAWVSLRRGYDPFDKWLEIHPDYFDVKSKINVRQ